METRPESFLARRIHMPEDLRWFLSSQLSHACGVANRRVSWSTFAVFDFIVPCPPAASVRHRKEARDATDRGSLHPDFCTFQSPIRSNRALPSERRSSPRRPRYGRRRPAWTSRFRGRETPGARTGLPETGRVPPRLNSIRKKGRTRRARRTTRRSELGSGDSARIRREPGLPGGW